MGYPCDRFAALLAHCLNSEDAPIVHVNLGALYARITDALATRYADPLLHRTAYASRMSGEEAALHYFEVSLARRLILSGRVELSVAHRLFEALCHRGADAAWPTAVIERNTAPPLNPRRPTTKLDRVRDRLAQIPDTLSPGSASSTLRTRHGPVTLTVGVTQVTVAEELSVWDAITCAPDTLNSLSPGETFNRFCSVMIDCIRTAHRPVQEMLGLGRRLCPFDWLTVLSIQQVRRMRRFLDAVQGADSPASWTAAWKRASVPGFADANALWHSDIGLALRGALASDVTELEDDVADTETEFLSATDYVTQLDLMVADGVIEATERSMLIRLYKGCKMTDMAVEPEIKMALRRRRMTFDVFVADLQARIERWGTTQARQSE